MTGKAIDLTGRTFERLTVVGRQGSIGSSAAWLCRCVCGAEKAIPAYRLKRGGARSCGCLRTDNRIAAITTHGMSKTREFKIWDCMIQRCHNPKAQKYHLYGGRGIAVCQRWRESFAAFIEDMGPRPTPKHSVERLKNDRGYEPDNCEWATQTEQMNNTSSNRILEFNYRKLTTAQWARELGIPDAALRSRLFRGWSVEKALSTPLRTQ